MESPVRKMLKRNDYNRHKLLRKIKRRRKAEAEQQSHVAEKELKRKLRVTPPKFDFGMNPELDTDTKSTATAAERAGRVPTPHRRGTTAPNAAAMEAHALEVAARKEAETLAYVLKKLKQGEAATKKFDSYRRATKQMEEMATLPITSELYNLAVLNQEDLRKQEILQARRLYGLLFKPVGTVADVGALTSFYKARKVASALSEVQARIAQLERTKTLGHELNTLRNTERSLLEQNRNYNILQRVAGGVGMFANGGQLLTGDGDIIDAIGAAGGAFSVLGATDWLRKIPRMGRYVDDVVDWGGAGMLSIDLTKTGLEAVGMNMDLYFPPINFDKGKSADSSESRYVVKKGDWLSKIAQLYTGDANKYIELSKYNNINNPDKIDVGLVIKIPSSWTNNVDKKNQSVDEVPQDSTTNDKNEKDSQKNTKVWYDKSTGKWNAITDNDSSMYTFTRDSLNSDSVNVNMPEVVVVGKNKRRIKQPDIDFSKEQANSLYVARNIDGPESNNGNPMPSSEKSIWSKLSDEVYDASQKYLGDDITLGIKTIFSGDFETAAQMARLLYARKINEGDDVITNSLKQPQMTAPKLKQEKKESDVLDETLEKSKSEGSDTLWWKHERGVKDHTGRKFYLRRSVPITDDLTFGTRNRKEYLDLNSRDAFITTYDTDGSNPNFLTYDLVISSNLHKAKNWSGKDLLFIGVTPEGKLRIGDISLFKKGDTMKAILYLDVGDIPKDKNGKLKYNVAGGNSSRFSPMLSEDGTSALILTERNSKAGRAYNNIAGGSYILRCGNETRLVTGSIDDIVAAHELMRKNHKGKTVRWYAVDNGSYNRGLRTEGLNITALDLKDYDSQNPRGGGFIYLMNK